MVPVSSWKKSSSPKKNISTGSRPSNPSSKKSVSRTTSPRSWALNPFEVELSRLDFHATCSEGLQTLLEEEIRSFHLDITSSNRGGVFFRSKNWIQLECFLFSTRYSSQVGILLADWQVTDYDSFYGSAVSYPWEKLFPLRHSFRIDSRTKDILPDSRFSMYKLKDAILDRYRKMDTPFPDLDKDQSDVVYFLRSHQDHAIVELLLTPQSLTKRNYRSKAGEASLRENIAQAILGFSDWNPKESEDFVLIDPFCGQGTILIEAALLLLSNGEIQKTKVSTSLSFQSLKRSILGESSNPLNSPEEGNLSQNQNNSINPILIGIDNDSDALDLARKDSLRAGVNDKILWVEGSIEDLPSILDSGKIPSGKNIFIITDPPYGKRLGTPEEARSIFESIGKTLKSLNRMIRLTVITGDSSLLGPLRLKKDKEMSLKNAGLSSKIVNYTILPK